MAKILPNGNSDAATFYPSSQNFPCPSISGGRFRGGFPLFDFVAFSLEIIQIEAEKAETTNIENILATRGNAGANPVYTAQFSKLFERGGKREFRSRQAEAQVNVASAQVDDVLRNPGPER